LDNKEKHDFYVAKAQEAEAAATKSKSSEIKIRFLNIAKAYRSLIAFFEKRKL
jgi:hypothetical protein